MSDARAKSRRKRPLRELNRGTVAPGVEDVSTPANFETRQTADEFDAKGGPRLRQNATDERTPDDGVENTRRDELPRVAESV